MSEQEIEIRAMIPADWPAIRAIYIEGIEGRMATFETNPPTEWETWSAGKRPDCRFVACLSTGEVIGWVALSPTSKRAVYAGVCEVSIYLASTAAGRGVGSRLMRTLVEASEAAGIWTLTASIFPENEVSLRLHEKVGFERLGRRKRIAKLDGVWRDTIAMERRSEIVN